MGEPALNIEEGSSLKLSQLGGAYYTGGITGMKKNKQIVALGLAATMAVSSVTPVFAQGQGVINLPSAVLPAVVPVQQEVPVEEQPVVAQQVFAPLATSSQIALDHRGMVVGSFPQLTQVAGNPDFARLNNVFRTNVVNNISGAGTWGWEATMVPVAAVWEVNDEGRFATVTQNITRGFTVVSFSYIIDKYTGMEITGEQRQAIMDEEAAAAVPVQEEEAEGLDELPAADLVGDEEEVEEAAEEEAAAEVEAEEVLYEEELYFEIVELDGVLTIILGEDDPVLEAIGLGLEIAYGDEGEATGASFLVEGEQVLVLSLGAYEVTLGGEVVDVTTPVSYDYATSTLAVPLELLEMLLDYLDPEGYLEQVEADEAYYEEGTEEAAE